MVVEDCRNDYTYERICRSTILSAINTVTLGCLCYLAKLSNSFLTFLQSTFVSYLHVNYLAACRDIFVKV